MATYLYEPDDNYDEGGCWPTPEQELLLRATLCQGKDAIEAWHEWRSKVDIDRLDEGSHRLLPLLYHNLRRHEVKEPVMEKLKGVYRQTSYKNHLMFYRAAGLLRSFQEAGIKTMLLKGSALVALHYRDPGLRPMHDLDVLVPTEQALAAIKFLSESGWKPTSEHFSLASKPALLETYLSYRHSTEFTGGARWNVDLHWHALFECCQANADDDLWSEAVTTQIGDVTVKALCPTDQLLNVCVHGVAWNPVPPLRWVADAMMILDGSQSEIDWNRLATQARKRRLTLPLKDAVDYLRDKFNAPVPEEILQSMKRIPASRMERIRYDLSVSPQNISKYSAETLYWLHHLRMASSDHLPGKLVELPRSLKSIWHIAHLRYLPFYVLHGYARRILARLHRLLLVSFGRLRLFIGLDSLGEKFQR